MSQTHSIDDLKIHRPADGDDGSRRGLWILLLALVLIVAAGAWWLLRDRSIEVQVAPVTEVRGAEAAASSAVLDASGYVTARRRATVSSKITAKIIEVHVEEGLEVHEGQVLARLDNAAAVRQLALAEAELAAAQRVVPGTEVRLAEAQLDLDRMRKLAASDVSSQSDLDHAQAQLDALKAQLEVDRQQIEVSQRRLAVRRQDLEDTVIRAPFDGVVVTKDAQPGEMISPVSAGGGFTRTGICTVVDMKSLEIEVDVNEAYINRVQTGQRVLATLDAYPDWRIPGSVITPVPTADRQKATVLVRIRFDQLDPRILPDMGVKVSFLEMEQPTTEVAAERVRRYIPAAAVRQDAGADVVLVLRGERVERRAVRLGQRNGDTVEVLAGLNAGDQVVTAGPPELADGDRVRVR